MIIQVQAKDLVRLSARQEYSPDLNPFDYSILGALQQRVYRERIVNVEHLKRVITRCWTEISQELINGAIDQWALAFMQSFELVEDTLNIYLIK